MSFRVPVSTQEPVRTLPASTRLTWQIKMFTMACNAGGVATFTDTACPQGHYRLIRSIHLQFTAMAANAQCVLRVLRDNDEVWESATRATPNSETNFTTFWPGASEHEATMPAFAPILERYVDVHDMPGLLEEYEHIQLYYEGRVNLAPMFVTIVYADGAYV